MPVTHVSKVFAIREARISKLLTDPTGAPPATYGASVVLTGSQKLTLAGTIKVVYLRGDNQLLDSDAVLETMTATLDYAKLNLDAMAVMFSTAVVDTGTTPNQLATWPFKNTDTLNYFKIEARSAGADPVAGDALFSLWKCKLTAFPPIGLAEEDYMRSSLTLTVVPRLADNNWISPVIRETAAVLT